MTTNKQWRVAKHVAPEEIIGEEHFELVDADVPDIGDNEFLARTLILGTSPAQRGYIDTRMTDTVPVGSLMRGRGIAVVEKSNHPEFTVGDWVNAPTGWQQYSVQKLHRRRVSSMDVQSVQKVDNSRRPSSLHLGILGSTAFTALYGIEELGEISAGKTVVVSASAGGVGSMVCQIAKLHNCRVIGIAGGPAKCEWIRQVAGCDQVIDYKNNDVGEALDKHCPNGIDIFFDNVGGSILDTALARLAMHARVVVCGYISTDYRCDNKPGPSNYTNLLRKRARMEGFVIWDHVHRYPEFFAKLGSWYANGKISRDVEEVVHGIELLPSSLQSLFTGTNRGIRLVQVGAD